DSFVYEVCDNGSPIVCDQATVVITINPANCTEFVAVITGENVITCNSPIITLDASSSTIQGTAIYKWS
uniref:hypothetical protein n=1 Tax=uncultured Lutibacter sp. TaxID=437739 RepID=UPI0026196578